MVPLLFRGVSRTFARCMNESNETSAQAINSGTRPGDPLMGKCDRSKCAFATVNFGSTNPAQTTTLTSFPTTLRRFRGDGVKHKLAGLIHVGFDLVAGLDFSGEEF